MRTRKAQVGHLYLLYSFLLGCTHCLSPQELPLPTHTHTHTHCHAPPSRPPAPPKGLSSLSLSLSLSLSPFSPPRAVLQSSKKAGSGSDYGGWLAQRNVGPSRSSSLQRFSRGPRFEALSCWSSFSVRASVPLQQACLRRPIYLSKRKRGRERERGGGHVCKSAVRRGSWSKKKRRGTEATLSCQ